MLREILNLSGDDAAAAAMKLLRDKNRHDILVSEAKQEIGKSTSSQKILLARLLSMLGTPNTVSPLIELLKDDDRRVQWNAAQGLKQVVDDMSCKKLEEILLHNSYRNAHKLILDILGDPNLQSAISLLCKYREKVGLTDDYFMMGSVLAPLSKHDKDLAVNLAEEYLQNDDEQLLLMALAVSSEIKSKKFHEVFHTKMSHLSPLVRRAAIRALAMTKEIEVEEVLDYLSDSDEQTRWEVVTLIENIGGPQSVETLVKVLAKPESDEIHNLRWGIERVLERIGGEDTCRAVVGLLNSSDEDVSWRATLVLENIATPILLRSFIEEFQSNPAILSSLFRVLELKEIPAEHFEYYKEFVDKHSGSLAFNVLTLFLTHKPLNYEVFIADGLRFLKERQLRIILRRILDEGDEALWEKVVGFGFIPPSPESRRMFFLIQHNLRLSRNESSMF